MFALSQSPLADLDQRSQAQALVELAFIVPVILLLTLGLIDLGRAFVFGVSVQEGSRQAARLAASANTDTAVVLTNSDVLGRLVAGSSPALIGCLAQTTTQSCNGGTWTLTVTVVGPSGTSYSTVEAARAANDLAGAQVTVAAAGSVALLPGISTGNYGLVLPRISVQGQSSMVVL